MTKSLIFIILKNNSLGKNLKSSHINDEMS